MAGKRTGKGGIRVAIDQAETIPPQGGDDTPDAEAQSVKVAGGRLVMRASGLLKVSDETGSLPIAGHFTVMSQTRDDEATAWGLMLRFRDPDGMLQHVVVRRDLFAGEGGELRSLLARRGLYINPSKAAGGLLAEYLSRLNVEKRARIVGRTGWHAIDGAPVFVLPGQTFSVAPVEIIYQAATQDAALFNAGGTADEWRTLVAAPCVGNSRLVFAVSAAFAGTLLDPVGEDGGGIHFRGASRIGKTSALRVAASVWGGEGGSGAAGYIRQWRATDNAMEGLALAQSDTLLPLDELGQADPRTVGDTAYLLASGQGKARSDRSGGLRAPVRFRVLFLSTGELSLADKIAEAGRRVKAGQEIRLLDVPADAGKVHEETGKRLGLFEDLHGAPDAEAFIQALRAGTGRAFGTAAPRFLEILVARRAADPDFADRLRKDIGDLVAKWLKAKSNADGQVRSAARRFALIAVAGELATTAGITGWNPDDASDAAWICFDAWLTERGTAGAREDAQAVQQLRDFLTRHGDSRFQEWRTPEQSDAKQTPAPTDDTPTSPPTSERFRTVNRAGWRRKLASSVSAVQAWHYYLTPDGMKEALAGLDQRQAKAELQTGGFILAGGDGKLSRSLSPPGHDKTRLYHVLPAIFDAEAADAD